MRLIDADKVAKNVYDRIEKDLCWHTSPYVCDELEVCLPKEDYEYLRGLTEAQDYAVKTINKEPTVGAITVEFIEKKIVEYNDWNEDVEPLLKLIEDWRKVNEKSVAE